MNTNEFDYTPFFDGSESPSAHSTTTTTTASPRTTESDVDSGTASTPLMPEGFDSTVIDLDSLDFFAPNMEDPLCDDLGEDFNEFASSFLKENDSTTIDQNSIFDTLFTSPLNLPEQVPAEVPVINNCIKLHTPGPLNRSIIKIEPVRLIPITAVTPSVKRRRADSPVTVEKVSETLTLQQLKAQYGNMSEEALKKHLRMIKNRESASLSRKRRKEHMESLDVQNKRLTDDNEQLRKQNAQLLTRIHALEVENELLRKYSPPRKSLKLMGIVLLFAVSIFMFKSFSPNANLDSSLLAYETPGAIVPSRTILAKDSAESFPHDSLGDEHSGYPYIQCVAFINKTHSQRINQDLRSWVQEKEEREDSKIIPDPKSLTIAPVQHPTRKVARQAKIHLDSRGQLQPYKTSEINYDDFIRTIDRKNDTLYFISFKRDHLILPAGIQNQTQRPKMTLILPASMANLNKSIHVPINHVPMLKIDCEVDDTKLVFIKESQIPSSYRDELSQYYSLSPQASL